MSEDKKKRILFLDDRSKRLHSALKAYKEDDLTLVTTVQEAKIFLSGYWEVISLDHDLNFETLVDSNRKDCGMEVVRYLCENAQFFDHLRTNMTRIIIHSSNRPAAVKMVGKLIEAGYDARWVRWEYDDEP